MTNTQDTFEANNSIVTISGRTYTHRTRDGRYARIICDDRISDNEYSVFALILDGGTENLESLTKDLMWSRTGKETRDDLFKGTKPSLPKTDWSKVPVDTPIWVSCGEGHPWVPRHFAYVSDGLVYTFLRGNTSHTESGKIAYPRVTLTNPNT
jgi:hypothetical protein